MFFYISPTIWAYIVDSYVDGGGKRRSYDAGVENVNLFDRLILRRRLGRIAKWCCSCMVMVDGGASVFVMLRQRRGETEMVSSDEGGG